MCSALVPLTSAGYSADYYIPTCPQISIFVLIAFESLCVMPMHVIWAYLTMWSYPKRDVGVAIWVAVWHIMAGLIVSNCVLMHNWNRPS